MLLPPMPVVLKMGHVWESPRGLVKTQIAGPLPCVWAGCSESAFLTSSQWHWCCWPKGHTLKTTIWHDVGKQNKACNNDIKDTASLSRIYSTTGRKHGHASLWVCLGLRKCKIETSAGKGKFKTEDLHSPPPPPNPKSLLCARKIAIGKTESLPSWNVWKVQSNGALRQEPHASLM